jgi:phosphoglycolate phosphatase
MNISVNDHRPTLLIFDVDGTLTYSAGLTRVAYDAAAEELYQLKSATAGINPHGRTEQAIFREILTNNVILCEDFDAEFLNFTEKYVAILEVLLNNSAEVHPLAGVRKLLERLTREPGIYLALGTGNVERGAFLKLHRHGIAHYFPIGGFGSDNEERPELLTIALDRAQRYYRIPFPIRDTWVIGDTPNDILSGRSIGASTLAVATGSYDMQYLARFKPTALLPDLEDADRFLEAVRGRIRLSDAIMRLR